MISQIEPNFDNICLATLNYDSLLEQALSINHHDFSLKPFCKEDKGPYLLKLHGSANWLPLLPPNFKISNVSVSNPDMTLIRGCTKPHYASNTYNIAEWHQMSVYSSLAPIMCNYAEGKNCMVNPEVIDKVQEFWSSIIESSKRVVLVGVRYIEEDSQIWDVIESSECDITVVNPDKNEFDLLKKCFPDKNIKHINEGFENAIPAITEIVLTNASN